MMFNMGTAVTSYKLISTIILVISLTGCCFARSENKDKAQTLNRWEEISPEQEVELIKRVDKGDSEAAFGLYLFYDRVQNNKEKGFYWLNRAAEMGHVGAQNNLGYLYVYDKSLRDLEKAKYWLIKVAPSDGYACLRLADIYAEEKEFSMARSYYLMGAEKGNRKCWRRISEYLYSGIGGERDNAEAYYWISLDARCTDPRSIGGKEIWNFRDKIAEHLSSSDLKKQWGRIDDYIELVRSKKISVDYPPFLEGKIKKESSDEGVKFADKREREHRSALVNKK